MRSHLAKARAYLDAIERGALTRRFFTDDAIQEEYPNRLSPSGGRSDVAEMLARAERGKSALRWQRYDVLNAFESGNTVILEVSWSATFQHAIGSLPPGEVMRARFAGFLEFDGDKIRRQRNYDCFDPF